MMPSPPSRWPLSLPLIPLVIALSACGSEAQRPAEPTPLDAVFLESLWSQGASFGEFLEGAEARRERWTSSYEVGTVSSLNAERARRVSGQWKLLVVAEDWCGDSAANIPYVARLVEAMPSVEFRVVNSTVGKAVLESHPTPDGRAATPTVLLLDEGFSEVGCWVERPAVLQAWYQANKSGLPQQELYDRVWEYYDASQGEDALSEILLMMERAEAGLPACGLR